MTKFNSNEMKRGWRILMWVIIGIGILIVFGLVTQYLWNWLVPTLFNGPFISFWQALGLILLSKILFSGLGHKCHHHSHGDGHPWKQRLHEKFSAMSPEEREAFKKKMWDKWCSRGESDKNEP